MSHSFAQLALQGAAFLFPHVVQTFQGFIQFGKDRGSKLIVSGP